MLINNILSLIIIKTFLIYVANWFDLFYFEYIYSL